MKASKIILKVIIVLVIVVVVILAAVLLFLRFSPTVGAHPGKEDRQIYKEKNEYFDGKAFHNINDVSTMSGETQKKDKRAVPENTIPCEEPTLISSPSDSDLTFTWIGHSSSLLQMNGMNILIDPVLSDRSSPVGFAGPKRFSECPFTYESLPKIDVLFVSHDHYDHLDYKTIKNTKDKVDTYIVPLGVDVILKGWGVDADKIRVLNWWEDTKVGDITFTLTPSQHFTGRDPLRSNTTLWGGLYLSSEEYKVYYTGDSGYFDGFAEVGERLGAPDLMLAECGQYDEGWAKIHMFPEQTAQAGIDCKAKWVVPIHWGAFCICNNAWDDSAIRVTAAAEEKGLDLATPRIGQTVNYSDISSYNERWWENFT